MNDSPGIGNLPPEAFSATDVDPRFDEAVVGTAPPRAEAPSPSAGSLERQLADIVDAASGWVRAKPVKALAIAAGIGFLLGRSGR